MTKIDTAKHKPKLFMLKYLRLLNLTRVIKNDSLGSFKERKRLINKFNFYSNRLLDY